MTHQIAKRFFVMQVNLDMTDSMGPGKLVRHMQNLSYTYDEYLICIGLGPNISSVICKNPLYSGPSYPSSPVSIVINIVHVFEFVQKSVLTANQCLSMKGSPDR